MSTRSLRHRSSRLSSPATFGEKESGPKPVEAPPARNGQQSNLDAWIEPAVRPAVPSFEDTKGLERAGVLENMQPLGVAPSQRLLHKFKLNYARPSPRATSTPAQAEEVVTPVVEPEPEPEPEPEKIDLASSMESEMLPDHPAVPRQGSQAEAMMISSPPRGRPPRREVVEMSQAANVSPSPAKSSGTPSSQVPSKPASIQAHLRQDRLRNHIDHAVQEAIQKGTPDLVPGLQRFRDDARVMPELWNVLEAVLQPSPTPEQFRTFKHYIKNGLKDYRRSSQFSASPYQSSPHHLHDPISQNHHLSSYSSNMDPTESPGRRRGHISLFINGSSIRGSNRSARMPNSPSHASRPAAVMDSTERPSEQPPSSSPNKRKRSRSVSTSSSLSSAKSLPPPDDFGAADDREQPSEGRAPGSARVRATGQRQASSRAAAGNRLRSAASATDPPSTTVTPVNAPTSKVASAATKKLKRVREPDSEFDIDELAKRKKTFLDDSFHDYNTIPRPESNEREPVLDHPPRPDLSEIPPKPVVHPNRLLVSQDTAPLSPVSAHAPPEPGMANGTNRKRRREAVDDSDEVDATTPEPSSPPPLRFPSATARATSATSRATTPRTTRLPPTSKARRSARVMVSPNKPKNGGITAGISRGAPGRESTIANGGNSSAEDNDEFCASCGGEGKLLCCDGCTNSFHHACLEPPLNPEEEVEGEWFCPRCVARRSKQAPQPTGLLGPAIRRVEDIIPKAFALPVDIREYFEGVRTGDEGEYEEVGLPRTQNNTVKMNRAGFIEEPNYKETRDSKGKLITCFKCGHTADGRDIIPCDYCPARWHLDCVDPPLAVPPRRRAGDKPGATWRCPLHVEHDLAAVARQAEVAPGELGRVPTLRKPKNAVPVDAPLRRGFRNNGIIEVELDEDEPVLDRTKEVDMMGKIYRLPEKDIRLDFIDRVKRSWYEDQQFPQVLHAPKRIRTNKYRPDGAVLHHPPEETIVKEVIREPDFFTGATALAIAETAKANAALRRRSIREQQAVLHLVEMSQQQQPASAGDDNGDVGAGGGLPFASGDALADLTNQLVSEAPQEVVDSMQDTELDQLLMLQQLISKRLAVLSRGTGSKSSAATQQQMNGDEPCASAATGSSASGQDQVESSLTNSTTTKSKSKMVNGDKDNTDTAETAPISSRVYDQQKQYPYEDYSVQGVNGNGDGSGSGSDRSDDDEVEVVDENTIT
ncbi:hypothetical protein ABEF91_008742 [Exophiala dermatitidis]